MRQWERVFYATLLLAFTYTTVTFITMGDVIAQAVNTVDMRPAATAALEWVAMALTTVLTVLGGFAIRFVSSKTGLANSELERSLNDRLNEIINRGIDYAYATALNEVNKPGSGLAAVKFDNWFLSLAASYTNRSAKDIIGYFKLDQTRIEAMIKARMPAYLANVPIEGALPTPTPSAT